MNYQMLTTWMNGLSHRPSHCLHLSLLWHAKEQEHVTHYTLLIWREIMEGHTSASNLAALPPTNQSFIENVKRAHFSAALWQNVDGHLPPAWNL